MPSKAAARPSASAADALCSLVSRAGSLSMTSSAASAAVVAYAGSDAEAVAGAREALVRADPVAPAQKPPTEAREFSIEPTMMSIADGG